MPKKIEYRILPQVERDDFHSHVRNGPVTGRVSTHYICMITLTLAVIVLILVGVATLTASMFYSDQMTKTFGRFWFDYSIEKNTTEVTLKTISVDSDSSIEHSTRNYKEDLGNRTIFIEHSKNLTDYQDGNKTELSSFHYHHHHHHNNVTHQNLTSGSSGESDSQNGTYSSESSEQDSNMGTGKIQETIDMEDLKEKFAEAMRDLEKRMETITGIRQAEFVIPLFMLICFLLLFSMISLCCCIWMRRKDNRRRKVFGKLITDLQTGDSKTVLLNSTDLDD